LATELQSERNCQYKAMIIIVVNGTNNKIPLLVVKCSM